MRTRQKKNLIIGILSSLLVFMGIGYAVLSQVLTINVGSNLKGNWNIYIESITPYSVNGDAKSLNSEVGLNGLSATFESELNAPGDSIEYKVIVKNGGNISAKLISANLVPKKMSEYIVFTTTAVENTEVKQGSSTEFIVKVEFKDVESFETDEAITALTELQLGFVQIDNNSTSDSENDSTSSLTSDSTSDLTIDSTSTDVPIVPDSTSDIEEPIFTVNSEGLITSYNYDNGTDVVVPAEVNGIPVRSIDSSSFAQGNVKVGYAYNESTDDEQQFLIISDQANKTQIEEIAFEIFCEEFSDSGSDEDSTSEGTNYCGGMTSLSDMGISVYNSMEEAEKSFAGYEIGGETVYVDIEKGELGNARSKITRLDLSEATNLEEIGERAFFESDLTTVIFPTNGNLTTIGYKSFSESQLTSVTIPSIITNIAQGAFEYNQLTSVTIPASVTSIGDESFLGNQLASITFEDTEEKPSQLTTIEYNAFLNNQLTSVTIPSSVTSIGMGAFQNNQLTSVTIPASVGFIYFSAFAGNLFTSETDITIKYNSTNFITRFNSQWASIGFPGTGPKGIKSGCYYVDVNNLSQIIDYDETCGTEAIIPSTINDVTITNIGWNAFKNKQLTSVTIPYTITTITTSDAGTTGAFEGNSIAGLVFEDTAEHPSQLTKIDYITFKDNQLTSIIIPASVTSISEDAFTNNQITSVTVNGVATRFNEIWSDIGFGNATMPS